MQDNTCVDLMTQKNAERNSQNIIKEINKLKNDTVLNLE